MTAVASPGALIIELDWLKISHSSSLVSPLGNMYICILPKEVGSPSGLMFLPRPYECPG
jgi:hypothetical protein